MHKKIIFIIILFVAIVSTIVVPVVAETIEMDTGSGSGSETYVLNLDGCSMSVNKKTLNFTYTNGTTTWYSGARFSEDDGLNNIWASKVTDAITVGYRSSTTNIQTEKGFTGLNSRVTFKEKKDGFSANIIMGTLGVTLKLDVTISSGKLIFSVPYSSITETKTDKYQLMYIMIYPFFNSSYDVCDGYILVPDGSGATIDLSNKSSAKQRYTARVYGEDYSIGSALLSSTSPNQVQMPIYGISYQDKSSLTCISSGDEYSEINAYVSGITTNYNFAYARFIYRQEYTKRFSSNAESGKTYIATQENKNEFDATLTVFLFEERASIADFAKVYQQYLTDNNLLSDSLTEASPKLRLQFLMAENKESMFGKSVIPMTSASFVKSTIEQLKGIDLTISLLGYTKGGLTGSYPSHLPFESKTGSDKEYRELFDYGKSVGVDISLSCDYCLAYGGNIGRSDKAMNIAEQFMLTSSINSQSLLSLPYRNLLTTNATKKYYEKDLDRMSDYNISGIDLYSIGRYIYGSYLNQTFTRSQAIKQYNDLLKTTSYNISIDSPNQYLWKHTDNYIGAPSSNSGYIIETQSVPFLQLVLSGYINMYSNEINLNYIGADDILKLIEYNMYPSYLLTEKDCIELYGTESQYIFTGRYDLWIEQAKSAYNSVNECLSKVVNQKMISWKQIEEGVMACGYSNGVTIIVNYRDSAIAYQGNKIDAKSARAVEI